jgi:signal transduction histidine kinase/DNA-binding response OmpR family regulator/HPt (histidine-containing phosphotransfer) domain-containing protein/ABC-type amino acid transport substrate-binding protein
MSPRSRPYYFLVLLFFSVLGSGLGMDSMATGLPPEVKIGVLAKRGEAACTKIWSPTADYLGRMIPGQRFTVACLDHRAIHEAVLKGQVDFILANPSIYIELEAEYGANRIATLKNQGPAGPLTFYGAIIFSLKSRTDIRKLSDLKGRTFMAVEETSLGGWRMSWRELQDQGIDPFRDFKSLNFAGTHDAVVLAVADGRADAGTVRTDTLERMQAEGLIDANRFFVLPIPGVETAKLPFQCSTRTYPEWPLAKIRHVDDSLAQQVAVALLQMPPDDPAALAASCAGWTIPSNYQPVHECLKVLKIGPYADFGKISLDEVIRSYMPWLIGAAVLFLLLVAFSAYIYRLNGHIKAANALLSAEIAEHRKVDRELKAAKEIAEAATRTKSEFLANMSHEIRTPMNGVIAAVDLALSEPLPPKVEHYLTIIHQSAYALLGIINDILDFSKIEAGKLDLSPGPFQLNEVLDNMVDLFAHKIAAKGIELLFDIDPATPPLLIGDSLRLRQILTNLFSNAFKFTEHGVIVLTVELTQAAENRVQLTFRVKDTGIGIAADYLPLLFEPFTQADSSSTRKFEGTGLGLCICKQLVDMMGGHIGVESQLGQGSTFWFSLPFDCKALPSDKRFVVPPDILGKKALAVDDCEDSCLILAKMLESFGLKMESAASGYVALLRLSRERLKAEPLDLIIMDWRMPGMDGIETSHRIRKDLNLTLPIIMLTAFGSDNEKRLAEQAGINGFLTKPLYPTTLYNAIMAAFDKTFVPQPGHIRPITTRASIYMNRLRGARILVAEDNPTNQEIAKAILEKAGMTATIVNNGQQALLALNQGTYHAVLMDVQMPVMGGYEATGIIRQTPRFATLPIIAMTAHALKGDEERCLKAGMDAYIPKPVNQDRLFHALWRLVGDRVQSERKAAKRTQVALPGKAEPDPGWMDRRAPLPDQLPGLTIRQTMDHLNLDDDVFARILVGFFSNNRDSGKIIRKALDAGNWEELGQLVHSLKGSAGNIGALRLHSAAQVLEMVLGQGLPAGQIHPALEQSAAEFLAALDEVLHSLQSLAIMDRQPAERAAKTTRISPEPLAAMLADLARSLALADPQRVSQQLLPLKDHLDPSDWAVLERQVLAYDYDEAQRTLSALARKLQIG